MRLPALLSRRDPNAYKNQFGHVLILAGSKRMLGAAALCGLSAFRTGSGLVTIGVAKSLNQTLQAKISNEIMTWPLPQTRTQSLSESSFSIIKKLVSKFQAVAIGPGIGQETSTCKFVFRMIRECPIPMVVDADALNILSTNLKILDESKGERILTPHPGEMARLTGLSRVRIEKEPLKIARDFALKHRCILLLKGHRTIVASSQGKTYINKTGNSGMATAGSGDVLTGMIAALIGQGIEPFEAAKLGSYLHGSAGDVAAKKKGKVSLLASDIIDALSIVIKGKI